MQIPGEEFGTGELSPHPSCFTACGDSLSRMEMENLRGKWELGSLLLKFCA